MQCGYFFTDFGADRTKNGPKCACFLLDALAVVKNIGITRCLLTVFLLYVKPYILGMHPIMPRRSEAKPR